MTLSTRFPVAVHILTMLAIKQDGHVSSECIAKSVGTNAVVVRRILGMLQQAGFVTTQAGIQGGAKLGVEPDQITLLEIYQAVEEQRLFRMHDPHPDCPVACTVKERLNSLVESAEEKMKNELARTRLSRITKPALQEYHRWTS